MIRRTNNKILYIWIICCLFLALLGASSGFTAELTLSWTPPVENEDGSPLDDLDGYILYYGTSSDNYTQSIDVGNVTIYQASGLAAGTTYYLAITAYDTSGNESTYSTELIRTVQAADTTPPEISSIQTSGLTYSSAAVSWSTNEAADTQIEYGLSTSYGSSTTLNSSMTTSHSQSVSGLSASTLYHYRVLSRDAGGNLATSGDYTFTTTSPQTDYYCDNDNDGYIDSSISGTCSGTGCEPSGCQTTAGNDCNDNNISINPGAADDNCDGVDDNCDGTADNNYVITITSCGTGVCASIGQIDCQDGIEVNSCTPGLPSESVEATCDDLDNDCDGEVDENCAPSIKVSPVLLSEDFSGGIPDTWTSQGGWNSNNSCGKSVEYPLVNPVAIVDSSCTATSTDSLITDSFDATSCSSVDLTFSNQYYWYSGNMEIDVSDDGGETWSNNLYIDSSDGYPSPQWKDVDISAVADSSNAKVRFNYLNSSSNGFWALDNVWVTCQSSQVEFESTEVTSATRTIMITNSGNEDLSIGGITINGTDASSFSLTDNDSCSNQTLQPSKTCTFDVIFTSATLGSMSANLSIPSNDPVNAVSDVTLSGTVLRKPVPKLKVNGLTGNAQFSGNDNITVTIELDPGDFAGKKADWWVQYEYRNRMYYYDSPSGKWRRGSSTYSQQALTDISTIEVKNDSRTSRGTYKYYFGIDILMNGNLDSNQYFEDSITIDVQ